MTRRADAMLHSEMDDFVCVCRLATWSLCGADWAAAAAAVSASDANSFDIFWYVSPALFHAHSRNRFATVKQKTVQTDKTGAKAIDNGALALAMTIIPSFFSLRFSGFTRTNVPKLICEHALAVTYLISVCGWRERVALSCRDTASLPTSNLLHTYILRGYRFSLFATECAAFSFCPVPSINLCAETVWVGSLRWLVSPSHYVSVHL